MSLRVRLNLLITTMFVTILVLGTVLVIVNARRAVLQEIESSAQLALNLIDVPAAEAPFGGQVNELEHLRGRLGALAGARHLEVLLVADGRETMLLRPRAPSAAVPRWFERLVAPAPMELRRPLAPGAHAATEVVVRANPGDEIAESWRDAWPLLVLVFAVSILANGVFYVVVGRWLKPVDRIVAALDGIEQGDYRARLPQFDLPELSGVAAKFNGMAEVLERSRAQNRYLAQQTIAIQEDERRALAQELHDELGQSITAVKAVAASLGQVAEVPVVSEGSATITQIANQMYAVVRGMLRRLRPVLLDEFGLVRALESLVDGWNERHADVFCRLNVTGTPNELSDAANIGLYRVVQECLTNVVKHAAATEVSVMLEQIGERVRLTVSDNGRGFAPEVAPPGLGLLGMRERIEALQGTFTVTTAPGSGVAIAVDLPAGPAE